MSFQFAYDILLQENISYEGDILENAITKKNTKQRTTSQIKKEIEQERLEKLKLKEERAIKRQNFIEENKDKLFYCHKCDKQRPVEDFTLVFRNKKGTPEFTCKECKRMKQRKLTIQRTIERGY